MSSAILEVTPQHGFFMVPERYDGFPGKYKGFLMQYAILFACAPAHFSRYKDKSHKMLTLITSTSTGHHYVQSNSAQAVTHKFQAEIPRGF